MSCTLRRRRGFVLSLLVVVIVPGLCLHYASLFVGIDRGCVSLCWSPWETKEEVTAFLVW